MALRPDSAASSSTGESDMRRTGRCLCGKVTFSAEAMPRFQACHCSSYRKWVGGPFLSVPCERAEFKGPVKRYASSEGFERGFCETCGSNLFFHPIGSGLHGIPIGLFDDQSDLPFKAEFFIDEKPENYAFSNDTSHLTAAEFRDKFRK